MRPEFETKTNSREGASIMYSPKVKEDLIPILYKLAKHEGKSMTALVDEMIRTEIANRNGEVEKSNDETVSKGVKKTADAG